MPWQLRALAVRFDGRSLGEHPVAAPGDDDAAEKIWEMDGAARALVSADLDRMVSDLTSIPVAPPAQTPDFVASLIDGRNVVVEHTRICSEADKLIGVSLDRVQARATKLVTATRLPRGRVGFAFPSAPRLQYVDETTREMVAAMRDTIKPNRMVREPFTAAYPLLHEIRVHWTVLDPQAAPEARVEPWLIDTDPQEVANEIVIIIGKKAEKHSSYLAYGGAVWLTVWVDVRFCPPTTVLYRLEQMAVEHKPFEKVIVGCSTRAIVFNGSVPTYHQDF
jgi:hypothetical protein